MHIFMHQEISIVRCNGLIPSEPNLCHFVIKQFNGEMKTSYNTRWNSNYWGKLVLANTTNYIVFNELNTYISLNGKQPNLFIYQARGI